MLWPGAGVQLHARQAGLAAPAPKKAKGAMGTRFDIRRFHDAGLLSGAMPLAVLGAPH